MVRNYLHRIWGEFARPMRQLTQRPSTFTLLLACTEGNPAMFVRLICPGRIAYFNLGTASVIEAHKPRGRLRLEVWHPGAKGNGPTIEVTGKTARQVLDAIDNAAVAHGTLPLPRPKRAKARKAKPRASA